MVDCGLSELRKLPTRLLVGLIWFLWFIISIAANLVELIYGVIPDTTGVVASLPPPRAPWWTGLQAAAEGGMYYLYWPP